MRKIFSLITISLLLVTGCGGNGSSNTNTDSSSNTDTETTEDAVLEVFFTGTTSNNQDIKFIVEPNTYQVISDQRYYGLYGPQDSNSIDGFIYGTLNVSGNQVISSDGIDFFIKGASVFSTSIDATVEKNNFKGSLNYPISNVVDFDTNYSDSLNKKINSSTIEGVRTGKMSTLQGSEDATFTIIPDYKMPEYLPAIAKDAVVFITGTTSSGCSFSGSGRMRYDEFDDNPETRMTFPFSIEFKGSPCYLATQEGFISGIIIHDPLTKKITAVAVTADKTNGLLFIEQ